MSQNNFTPVGQKKSSKQRSHLAKIIGAGSAIVMLFGILVGYVMVQQGFTFSSFAQNPGKGWTKYGWNGTCFTKFTDKVSGPGTGFPITLAARYQCPGPFSLYSKTGCQGKYGKQTGRWTPSTFYVNGKSQVCIIPNGSNGPKDSKGCFTQQLDINDGASSASPEGFYSFQNCTSSNPDPKPTSTPTPTPATPTPTNTPTPTPTVTPPVEVTPTPPACVKPEQPANVSVSCGTCK